MVMAVTGCKVSRKGRSGLNSSEQRNQQYRQFSDLSSGGYSYEGSGREQIEFFRQFSNYNELIEKMSSSDRNAFEMWRRFFHERPAMGWV